jgi:hypothetical protein
MSSIQQNAFIKREISVLGVGGGSTIKMSSLEGGEVGLSVG